MASGDLLANSMIAVRRATTKLTTASTNVTTTETVIGTITAVLESGKTYAVMFHGKIASSVQGSSEVSFSRIREDNVSGAAIQEAGMGHGVTTSITITAYGEYTAGSTGNKTFVVTLARGGSSTGTYSRQSSATAPAFITVELIPT